jgi:hypothetical protein
MNNTGSSCVLLLTVVFHKDDALTDGLVLPGFLVAAREIFE